jgi:hypothetical protein
MINPNDLPVAPETSADILRLPMGENDSGADTVRGYLVALLAQLWLHGDNFSGKRPFGSGGWEADLYKPLVVAGLIDGELDPDYGYVDEVDADAADVLILAAIEHLNHRSQR